jgi:hypothetical protein
VTLPNHAPLTNHAPLIRAAQGHADFEQACTVSTPIIQKDSVGAKRFMFVSTPERHMKHPHQVFLYAQPHQTQGES